MAEHAPRERIDYLAALCRTVPYHIVEAVLRDPSEAAIRPGAVEGTLLFADLVGFTAMCERLASSGPDGLSRLERILSGLFERLLEQAIFPYQGYVVHFGGDSITVVFREQEHALRAAAAALSAQRHLSGPSDELGDGSGKELMARIGLSSGEIRIPVLGDAVQRATVCSGPVAHLALRMQRLAPPNVILAHASTLGRLGEAAEVAQLEAEHGQLAGLRHWPERTPVVELGDSVCERVEEKIALLEPFVPAPLHGRLMTTPGDWRIEGELRAPVIVFSEVWGLDEGAGNLARAGAVSQSVARAYRKYGGFISKVDLAERGHRLMVLFGLHRPSDNDGERAVLAALEATARVRAHVAAGIETAGIRHGIHTGSVYFGAIGCTYKHDITVVGDAVNTAARAAGAAAPFEIMATEAVLEPVRTEFEHSARPPLLVKGKSAPLELHVIHSLAEGKTHYVRHRLVQKTLAGRDPVLHRLEAIIDQAFAGHGRFIGVCGARGAGKSALLAAVVNHAVERGVTGIVARCRYATRSVPLAPVAAMFASFLGIASGDGEQERAERARAGLDPFGLRRGAPELLSLLQLVRRADGTPTDVLDLTDDDARENVLDSITEFVEKRVAQQPLLYVLEDVHLADTLTLQLASRLRALSGRGPFLFVATYRPDPSLDGLRATFAEEIALDALGPEALDQLLRHELRVDAVDPELLRFVLERTGGNPGHAIEIVRFLTERALVRVRAGAASAAQPGLPMLEDVVPRTLAQVALARLEELGAAERRVLRVASAIGRRFDRGLLEGAAQDEIQGEYLDHAMGSLQSVGVIEESPHEQHGFMFRDGVTRAVTYGTIPDAERRKLHQRIADAMEKLGDDPGPAAAMVAMHRERAGQPAAAAHWFERAARMAMSAGLLRETIDLSDGWSRVVGCLPPESRPSAAAAAGIGLLKLVATARLGLPAETIRLCHELLGGPDALGPAERCTVEFWLGAAAIPHADFDQARERLERVFATARASDVRADVARRLAQVALLRGELDLAELWRRRGVPSAAGDVTRERRLVLVQAELALARGAIEDAHRLALEQAEAARAERQSQLLVDCLLCVGRARLAQGDCSGSRQAFEAALPVARAGGRSHHEVVLLSAVGQAHVWQGQYELGRRPLERAFGLGREIGDELGVLDAQIHLGLAVAMSADPVEGSALCADALGAAQRLGLAETAAAGRLHQLGIAQARADGPLAASAAAALREPGAVMPWPLHQERRRRLLAT